MGAPNCTVADVLTKAMSCLGDPSGEITQEIQDDFSTAYLDLLSCLLKLPGPEITREVYYTLPANTGIIFPSAMGVNDFAEPRQIWERGNLQTASVASTSNTTPITVTLTAPSPWGTGSQVELNGIAGVPDWVNRDWFITSTGSTTFTLNGSIAPGAAGTGGAATWSVDPFKPMRLSDVTPLAASQSLGEVLGTYRWENGNIYVPGATVQRQLWIEYLINAAAPASGEIGLCEGRELNFLAYATAGRFAPKRGIPQGPYLLEQAYGPDLQADARGGMLRTLMIPIWQQMQQLPRQSRRYRPRRPPFPFLT